MDVGVGVGIGVGQGDVVVLVAEMAGDGVINPYASPRG